MWRRLEKSIKAYYICTEEIGSQGIFASGKRDDPELVTTRLPLLKRGSTGKAVESAQAILIHRGYACGGRKFLGRETPDGEFGPATEKAVRSFQTKAALEPDGEIGADTWAAMLTA